MFNGNTLRAYRAYNKWSLEDTRKQLEKIDIHITRQTIANHESGQPPNADTLQAYSMIYKKSIDSFFSEEIHA